MHLQANERTYAQHGSGEHDTMQQSGFWCCNTGFVLLFVTMNASGATVFTGATADDVGVRFINLLRTSSTKDLRFFLLLILRHFALTPSAEEQFDL